VRHELCFNLGVSKLLAGQPLAAFHWLQAALPKLWPWARLWHRLGEAALLASAERKTAAMAAAAAEHEHAHVGLGATAAALGARRILLPPSNSSGPAAGGLAEPRGASTGDGAEPGVWAAPPVAACWAAAAEAEPSFAYATVCFRNALAAGARRSTQPLADAAAALELGGAADAADSSPAFKPSAGGVAGAASSASASAEEAAASAATSARLNLAWLLLGAGDSLGALGALGDLPSAKGLAPTPRSLALCYAAEALCALGRAADASALLAPSALAELLQRGVLEDDAAEPEPAPLGSAHAAHAGAAHPTQLPVALRCVLATNMAVAYLAHDDVRAAEKCVGSALQMLPRAREPLLLLAYIQLCNGTRKPARAAHSPLPAGPRPTGPVPSSASRPPRITLSAAHTTLPRASGAQATRPRPSPSSAPDARIGPPAQPAKPSPLHNRRHAQATNRARHASAGEDANVDARMGAATTRSGTARRRCAHPPQGRCSTLRL
jgi:hypothetical protein